MKNKIKENIEHPEQLEKLYHDDNQGFKNDFFSIYSEIGKLEIAHFWKARLDFNPDISKKVNLRKMDIALLIIACLITGFLIKMPQLFDIDTSHFFYFKKNAALIVLLGLSLYAFFTKKPLQLKHIIISSGAFILSAVYINLLPSTNESSSIDLAYLHLPLFLWCIYGLVFIDFDLKSKSKRIDYIKYNGDLAILGAIILIAGGILTGITIGLFSAIDIAIEQFYVDYIVIAGLVSAPIVATFIIKNYPFVTNRIAPIIANIFSPLVLLTLTVYLISIVSTGKDPYNDRDFLIVFNAMLLGVMGLIVFSVSETSIHKRQKFSEFTLFSLSIITLAIDIVALSAILYRLGEYGFTPNRVAVLGSNFLIFGHLILIMVDLYKVNFQNHSIKKVEITIAKYLPIYTFWTIFVVFVLPLVFGFE